jgi:hypothetical protein
LVQDFSDDRRRILSAVEDLKPEGKTALYDAIVLGLRRVAHGKHLTGRALMGMSQQHLFSDATALALLGIGSFLDALWHARRGE